MPYLEKLLILRRFSDEGGRFFALYSYDMIFCTYLLIFKNLGAKSSPIFFNCYAPSTAEGVFFVLCIKKKCIFAKNKHKWKI